MIKAVALPLAVADVERSLDFYKSLGFQEIPSGGPTREVRSMPVDEIEAYAAHLESTGIPMSREAAG